MDNPTIYTVGGTVQAGGGIYIPRKSDDELLAYCRAGEFAFILSSRQVGKSSLMVRTAQQLESENIRSVIIDLSGIGVKISADEWYLGILDEISNTLKLKTNIFAWWSEHGKLSPATRMSNFFRYVLLKEVSKPVVLFFDEIDSTLSTSFSTDDFFAALRAIYNARSTVTDFKRLSFVMIGVATPSDLIKDDKRTPFNIGHRVDLTDFTLKNLHPLAKGLGENAEQVLEWVFEWTNGHPYLTQRLCYSLIERNYTEWNKDTVAQVVEETFFGERSKQDGNLQFVRDMLTRRAPDVRKVLQIYRDVCDGKPVENNDQSLEVSHLKITGIVHVRDGLLKLRNRIYERVFDQDWIIQSTPLPDYPTRMQIRAMEWELKKDNSRLLRGKELREAEKQFSKIGIETDPSLTELQLRFLAESKKYEKKVRNWIVAISTVTVLVIAGLLAWPILSKERAVPGQWVTISGGDFTMGMDQVEAETAYSLCREATIKPTENNCFAPKDLLAWSEMKKDVEISRFDMMDNEVTHAQYQQCVDDTACQPPLDWYYDASDVNKPATGLNWFQSGAYCAWLGGRLPTEGEWEKAASGPGDQNNYFPWGDTWDSTKANLEHVGDGAVQSIIQYANSDVSYYGIKNLSGNVREWTASESIPLADNQISLNIVLSLEDTNVNFPVIVRGGAWVNERSAGMSSTRGTDGTLSSRTTLGFRCVCPANQTCNSPWDWRWIWFGKY